MAKVYALISQGLHSDSSYYGIESIHETFEGALYAMGTTVADFMKQADHGDVKDFAHYTIECDMVDRQLSIAHFRLETENGYWEDWEIIEYNLLK